MILNQLLSLSGSLFTLSHKSINMVDLKILFALQRNPFFPKNFLTIGDWTARVSRKNMVFFSLCNIYIFTLSHLVYWYLIEKGKRESNSAGHKNGCKTMHFGATFCLCSWFIFSRFFPLLAGTCWQKSVNTAKKNALRQVKMPSLNVICNLRVSSGNVVKSRRAWDARKARERHV